MIFPNSAVHALYTTIASDAVLVSSGILAELHEVFNTDHNNSPWVGVYLNDISFEPHHANITRPWLAVYEFSVFVQDHSYAGGEKANDNVMRLLHHVLTAINSNRSLDGTVHTITSVNVTPFDRDIEEAEWFFTDEIIITAQVFA